MKLTAQQTNSLQDCTSVGSTGHIKAVDAIIRHSDCRISHYLALRLTNHPFLGTLTVESAVRAPNKRGQIIHLKSTYFLHLLQCSDTSPELEGVVARVVSTDIAFEGTFLNQDTRLKIDQSKIGIAGPTVDRALVLEYKDMLTGKSSKLPRSQCLRLGHKEIPKVRRLPDGRVPRIRSMGGLEGQRVILTDGPRVCLLRTSTGGVAVVELTSSRVHHPPRCVGDRNSPSNGDCAYVVDSRTEGVSSII